MNTKAITRVAVLLLLLLVSSTALWAQADKSKRQSPPATATGKVGEATITIDYSSPSVRGRTIWGELVPYNVVWRAGANEATIFKTDKNITVEGQSLPAGSYSLFAVPGKDEWKFIFNSQTGQWGIKRGGETNHEAAQDVLTVTVKPHASPVMAERLQYGITPEGFVLRWENVEVPVAIK